MATVKYSVSAYTADGTTTDYLITWDYLDDDHITVEVDGVSNDDPTANHTFVKLNDTTVRVTDGIGGAIAAGSEIQIRRNTPITTRPISFADGSALLAADLNKNSDYLLYAMQEALDDVDFSVQFQQEAEGFKDETEALKNLTATYLATVQSDATDADNHRIAAALSETNAAASETAAATSETNAATSATTAQTAETGAVASAAAALASENAAATSETNAATSETNAAASAAAAAGSEAGVAADAATATAKAAAAATSETNAANSATSSANSASASQTSATASAASASAAATSATNAAASEAAAATSDGSAATYATNAQNSATAAATSETNAATSATNAATSETNASTSETNAATSATAAATSEANAAASYDDFDDRYLGAKASDPTLDNDGDALITGALYFNTTDDVMKVYEGTSWVAAYASLSGSLLSLNNLSDVASPSAALTNLGLTGNSVLPNDAGYITISEVPANNSINEGDTAVTVFDSGTDGKVVVRVDNVDVAEFNDTHVKVPKGTTAERDPNAVVGSLRYNTTTGFFETYTVNGWGSVATPPSITQISPDSFSGESGSVFTIDGAFFDTETTVVFKGADGTEYPASTVTYISGQQLLATTAQNLPVINEPYKIKVVNGAGLPTESVTTIDAGTVPSFITTAGNIYTTSAWNESVSVSVQASDAETSVTGYSVVEGSLPTGLSLNASTGLISGTSVQQSTTTYNFTIEATDSAGNSNTRQFSIQIVNGAPVWTSPTEGEAVEVYQSTQTNIPLQATDPEGETVSFSGLTLPTGASVSLSDLVVNTSTLGSQSVSISATDGNNAVTRNFFINVVVPPPQYNWSYSLDTQSFSYTGGFPSSGISLDSRSLTYYGHFNPGGMYGNNVDIDRVWAYGSYSSRTNAPLDPLTSTNLQYNTWESAWWGNAPLTDQLDGLLMDVGPAREVQFAFGNLNGQNGDDGYLEIYWYDDTTSQFRGIGGWEIPISGSVTTTLTGGTAYTSRYWYFKRKLTTDWSRLDYLETIF